MTSIVCVGTPSVRISSSPFKNSALSRSSSTSQSVSHHKVATWLKAEQSLGSGSKLLLTRRRILHTPKHYNWGQSLGSGSKLLLNSAADPSNSKTLPTLLQTDEIFSFVKNFYKLLFMILTFERKFYKKNSKGPIIRIRVIHWIRQINWDSQHCL